MTVKRKKLLVIALAAVMMLCLLPAVALATGENAAGNAGQFLDMPDDWSAVALENAVANGLLNGTHGKILPNSPLTRAEMAAIITRAFGATTMGDLSPYADVKATDWYFDSIAKAHGMGILQGANGKMSPENTISRQGVFALLSRALRLQPATSCDVDFNDLDQLADWARHEVYALVNAGYIQGAHNLLNPQDQITRAQFAQLLYNIFQQYISQPGIVTEVAAGNIIVNAPGVTLRDLTVTGDLIIGDGVGDGEVILDNVQIEGRLVLRGGGENSIIIRGNSSVGQVIVSRVDGKISVKVEGGADVEVIYIDDGSDDVHIEGQVGSLRIEAGGITVSTEGATINTLEVAGAGTQILVGAGSRVDSIDVQGQASNTNIEVAGRVGQITTAGSGTAVSGQGRVDKVEVKAGADNTQVETAKTQIKVEQGVDGVTGGGGTAIPGGSTVNNNASGSGTTPSGGGGGGGGGDDTPSNALYVATAEQLLAALSSNNVTIVLTDSITMAETIVIPDGKTLTFDLNGKTLTGPADAFGIKIEAGGNLTLRDRAGGGQVTTSNEFALGTTYSTDPVIEVLGTFVMNSGKITTKEMVYWALGVTGSGCSATINGGSVVSQWGAGGIEGGAIAANGKTVNAGYALTINGGTITGGDMAIYLPSAGTTAIRGGTITGRLQGIEIRAGVLNISGGSIIADAARDKDATAGSGQTGAYTGALVAVKPKGANADGYFGDIDITLSGGTLTNNSGDAITLVNEKPAPTSDEGVSLTLDGEPDINGGLNIGENTRVEGDGTLDFTGDALLYDTANIEALAAAGQIYVGAGSTVSFSAIPDAAGNQLIGADSLDITEGYVELKLYGTDGMELILPEDAEATIEGHFMDGDANGYRIAEADKLTVEGALTLDHKTEVSGKLEVAATGSLTVNAGVELYLFQANPGAFFGELTNNGNVTNNGTITVDAEAVFTNNGTITGSGTITGIE